MHKAVRVAGVVAVLVLVGLLATEMYVRQSVSAGWGGVMETLSTEPRSAQAAQAVPNIRVAGYLADSELGYRPDPQGPGRNSFGVLGTEPQTPKPADVFRILVLGDSTSGGKSGFASMINTRFAASKRKPRVEVYDASVPGYSIVQKRLFAERVMPKIRPDLVVLGYALDDNLTQHRRLKPEGGLVLTQQAKRAFVAGPDSEPDAPDASYSFMILEAKYKLIKDGMIEVGSKPWDRREDVFVAWREWSWPLFEDNLTKLDAAVTAAGAKFAVIVFPFSHQIDSAQLESDGETILAPQRRVAVQAEALGVKLLDLQPVFFAHRDRQLFTDGFVPNEHAQRIVAEETLDWLFRSDLIGRGPAAS